jgi:hypothetical protein
LEGVVFSVAIDESHTVLLITLAGSLTEEDLRQLDMLAGPLVGIRSLDKVIVDLRTIRDVEVSLDRLAARAEAGPVLGPRNEVFVAASPLTLGVARQVSLHRERGGHRAIPIVPDLEAAYRTLGIDPPVFR